MVEKLMDVTFSNGAKIGVSATLDNYNLEDLKEFLFCASYTKKYSGYEQYAPNGKSPFLEDDWQTAREEKTPFTYKSISYNPYDTNRIRAYNVQSGEIETVDEFKWVSFIYFYKDDNSFSMPIALDSNNANLNKIRVVTNFDADKICNNIDILTPTYYKPFGNNSIPTSWADTNHPFMCDSQYYIYKSKDDMFNESNGVMCGIYPYAVIEKDDLIYFFDYYNFITNRMNVLNWNKQNPETNDFWFIGWDYNITKRLGYIYPCVVDDRFYWFAPRNESYSHTNESLTSLDNWLTYYSNGQDWDYAFEQYLAPSNIDEWNEYNSVVGLYFRTDKLYKPVIVKNAVVGFTDDLTAVSDIDNYTYDKGNKHEVPDTPPIDDTDKINPVDYRYTNEIGGFTTYYRVSRSQLAQIITAINTAEDLPDGYQFLPHVVSVRQYPFNVTQYAHGTTKNIVIGGYDTGVQGYDLDSTQMAIQTIATIKVPSKFNSFLDKAPYTQLSLFIPCCGWVDLPDICVGKSITVELAHDVINGGCIGIVKLQGMPIVQVSGKMGTDISISATENGLKQAALTQAAFSVGGGILSTGFALATGNPVGVFSGIMSTASSLSQGNIANNSNYTHQIGSTGDKSNDHISTKCYLRISFPIADIPDNFAHTYGYMCNQKHKLSECSGFTVCDKVDLTGITATENEKTRLKNILETGFYC